jgi:hypothetical protein
MGQAFRILWTLTGIPAKIKGILWFFKETGRNAFGARHRSAELCRGIEVRIIAAIVSGTKEIRNDGIASNVLALQRNRKMPRLSRRRQIGSAKRKGMHILLSARQREMPELQGFWRI